MKGTKLQISLEACMAVEFDAHVSSSMALHETACQLLDCLKDIA